MNPAQRLAFAWLTVTMPVFVFVFFVHNRKADLHSFLDLDPVYSAVFWVGYSIAQTAYVHGVRYLVLYLLENRNLQLDRQIFLYLVLAPMIVCLLIFQQALALETNNATELALLFILPFHRREYLGESARLAQRRGVSTGGFFQRLQNASRAGWRAAREAAKGANPGMTAAEEAAGKGASETVTHLVYPVVAGITMAGFNHALQREHNDLQQEQVKLARQSQHQDSLAVTSAKNAEEKAANATRLAEEAKESVSEDVIEQKIHRAVIKEMEKLRAEGFQGKNISSGAPTLPKEPSESPSEPSNAIVSSSVPSNTITPSSIWELNSWDKIPAFVRTVLEWLFSTFPLQ